MTLRIEYLADHLDAIPLLARWHHDEWAAQTPELTIADREERLRRRAQRGQVPTALVALDDGRVVGMACLVECDLDSHAHLMPWLASVLVEPSHRRRGVGSALCRRIAEEARALGFSRAYLFLTSDYLQTIERCLESLTDEDLWWRADEGKR